VCDCRGTKEDWKGREVETHQDDDLGQGISEAQHCWRCAGENVKERRRGKRGVKKRPKGKEEKEKKARNGCVERPLYRGRWQGVSPWAGGCRRRGAEASSGETNIKNEKRRFRIMIDLLRRTLLTGPEARAPFRLQCGGGVPWPAMVPRR